VVVVFDSNVWIAELGLRSPLGTAARFYIKHTKARLALPEVVRLEVEHNLKNRLKEYIARIEDNHRQLLTVFGTLKALVVPDPSAIEAKVNDLFNSLGIDILDLPFSLSSARRSFLQTMDKVPPSDRTQEFKDGVLWADCVQLLEQDAVCLVTADKAFFQDREYPKGLSRSLAAEIAPAKHRFSLMPSLSELLSDFRVDVSIEENVLVQSHLAKNAQAIDGLLSRNGFVLGQRLSLSKALYATEDPSVLYVEFSMDFEAKEVAGDGRMDGVVTLAGDGTYDTNHHTFANLRNLGDTLRFQQGDGTQREVRSAYAFAESVLGHRDVSHTVRYKLP
jgi:PIN domain